MTSKKKKWILLLSIAVVLLVAWRLFRYWEGGHNNNGPHLHYLTWVRPSSSQTDKLIVFVHGFGSNAKSAWTNERTGAYWPQLMAEDNDLSSYAVLTTNYSAPVVRLSATIEQTAQALEAALRDAGVYTQYSQVVFIAHSMGGLVVRRMLVILHNSDGDEALKRVGPVIFFATPTSGARLADLGSWLSLNPQARDLKTSDMNTFLQSLDDDWEDLLRQRNLRSAGHPQVFCSYELERTELEPGIWVQVVPELYAKTSCDEVPMGFDRDHFTLVKPDDDQDDVYKWTKRRVLGLEAGARKVSWTGGETLGNLVARLQSAYRNDHEVPEIVRFASTSERTISKLWIPPVAPDYEGASWGELLRNVAVDHPCLAVNVVGPDRVVELARRGPIKTCGARTICTAERCDPP